MEKAQTVKEMGDGLRRARSQKIEIELEKFTEQIRTMTKKEYQDISVEEVSECERLKKMVYLNRKIGYLKHYTQTADVRGEKLAQCFEECKKSEEEFKITSE
jgi:hypothetical protein